MKGHLHHLIKELSNSSPIKTSSEFKQIINQIDVYAANDIDRSYMLGLFFKNILDSDNLLPENKKILIATIKEHKLENYYYLKEKPDYKTNQILLLACLFIGIACILIGLHKIITGTTTLSINLRYLQPVVDNGGFSILTGICFSLPFIVTYKKNQKKKKFIESLLNPQ